jgi:hypothetical protein
VETPSEDTTEYEYWASGRLKKEERKGDVAYSREYAYNPDGSRDIVIRDDALNGSFWDVYVYNETSGRLESVMDIWTTDTHEFAWNPEGTLARWTDPNADYERVFSYDEEGRLTKIERDHGQSVQTAYEYSYTGDGIRHMKKDHLSEKEYRYGCSIDCGGTPLRVYSRELGSQGAWSNYEDYMNSPTFVWYNHSGGGSSDTAWLPGHWISDMEPPGEGSMFYQDAFGVQVAAGDFSLQAPMKRLPEYLIVHPELPTKYIPAQDNDLNRCLTWCKESDERCRRDAVLDRDIGFETCEAEKSTCLAICEVHFLPSMCRLFCDADYHDCRANVIRNYKQQLRRCDATYDQCRQRCYQTHPTTPYTGGGGSK